MNAYKIGIDAGSTTVKTVVLDAATNEVAHKSYRRHHADVKTTLADELARIRQQFKDARFCVQVTGSAGMGVAQKCGLNFVQELIASVRAMEQIGAERSLLVDIGGEDAKMVFFKKGLTPDIRMNGACAGGTGAFIDQMAGLLNMSVAELGEAALKSTRTYPIASRCGVFAKTDVQNLIARRLPICDIAASIFNAVALQTISSLAKGADIAAPILCTGGPLTFLPALRAAFARVMGVDAADMALPGHSEVFPALGAALGATQVADLDEVIGRIHKTDTLFSEAALPPLFEDQEHFSRWQKNLSIRPLPRKEIEKGESLTCFLGIDAGSTTTKVVLIDEQGAIRFTRYMNNAGSSLARAESALREFFDEVTAQGASVRIAGSASTGYGEDLMRAALGLSHGIVETMAHLEAAKYVSPQVSFVLDIGGQDIKSIFVENGVLSNVELNESCSSGCGSFLQSFAGMMNMELPEFTRQACMSKHPSDLGTRCTVFMNSKVKEALRGQATHGDIAAGLAISVVKNCLFKVLKISNMDKLGEDIVVQGGTFKNLAVLRALEQLSQKRIHSTDAPELMGAYGAALYARRAQTNEDSAVEAALNALADIKTDSLNCKGCVNRCSVLRFKFPNGNVCYAGNKCERFFHSNARALERGRDGMDEKYTATTAALAPKGGRTRIGIPRALNQYENFPFYRALFEGCGFDVELSDESTPALAARGVKWLMSDNICFPAKLANGHILNLVDKKVDRIFYPMVHSEEPEGKCADNCFNCPVVSGYPNVLKNSMSVQTRWGIAYDTPVIVFKSEESLRKTMWAYLKTLGVAQKMFREAFKNAVTQRAVLRRELCELQQEILNDAIAQNRIVLVFAGRPYHADPLVNQKAAQIAADLGAVVVTDDAFRLDTQTDFDNLNYVSQWTYPNRVVRAAKAVAKLPANVVMVQINSFGCGPDSFLMDEASDILKAAGKNLSVLRVDEIASPGSIRLRLRSLVESLRATNKTPARTGEPYRSYNRPFTREDAQKTVIVPWFSDILSPQLPLLAERFGYKLENIPPSTAHTASEGLKYAHNEVCYPATLVVGDIIHFLKGKKDPHKNYVVGITQTGGQCRATNYIALIKSALKAAGFEGMSVLSLNTGETYGNEQDAFKVDLIEVAKLMYPLILFSDSLTAMHSAIKARELVSGQADALLEKYIEAAKPIMRTGKGSDFYALIEQAAREFNSVALSTREVPVIGVLGEIYLKYNTQGQCHLIEWIREQGAEPVLPPLRSFMLQSFVNSKVNDAHHISKSSLKEKFLRSLAWKWARSMNRRADRALSRFKFYRPQGDIFQLAEEAKETVHLIHQFGEGWLIAGEIAEFAHHGIDKVVCVQPFGCIANHVVAKGIERRLRERHPQMGLLFLDIDSGVAPVNLQNRMHFLLGNTHASV